MRNIRILTLGMIALYASAPTAAATTFAVSGDRVGSVAHYRVEADDTLYEIARRYDLGIVEVLAANPGIDPWMPIQGTVLDLPTEHLLPAGPRRGIVINLSEMRLYYYPSPVVVVTYPIGIGQEGWLTPTGATTITAKRRHPTWVPPTSIRDAEPDLPAFVPPGPDNPMGDFALNLGWQSIAIHGTNRPYGIGSRSSHGCIRLYPEDIAALFESVKTGLRVSVIDQAYAVGWSENTLYLRVGPLPYQSDSIAKYQQPDPIDIQDLHDRIFKQVGKAVDVDWYAVDEAVLYRSGIPVVIGKRG